MDTEREKMLCRVLDATPDGDARRGVLRQLLGRGAESAWIESPFFCDYGANIELGERVYFNVGCVVLDVCPVRIGARESVPGDPEDQPVRGGASPSQMSNRAGASGWL